MLFVKPNAVQVLQCFDAWCIVPAGCILAQVVNHRSRGAHGQRVLGQTKSGQLRHAKLFPQNAFRIIALEDPVFQPGFHSARSVEQSIFGCFEQLLRASQ